MDQRELAEILGDLDKQLKSGLDIVILGGAAMILHYGASRATRDVDALVLRGDVRELRRAVREVAKERNLPDHWLNDAAKGFADILPHDFYRRLGPLGGGFRRLRLYALGRPEQVAMKIVALREQDLEDLEILTREMSESDQRSLGSLARELARTRADWAQKIHYFMQERGWPTE